MRRREFIGLLGGAALLPLAARAQQASVPVVGYLGDGSPEAWPHLLAAFRKGLSEMGHVEGRTVTIEYRWAYHDNSRLPELAADLARRRVAVIAALETTAAALAAKSATTTIPVVFRVGSDPVKDGLVASLNRPGGNLTGLTSLSTELGGKRLGILLTLLPQALRFAVLVNPHNPNTESVVADLKTAAGTIGRRIEVLSASTNDEIDTAFASLLQMRADALLVNADNLFLARRVQFATLSARHAMPTMYFYREFADAGGLMSYGTPNAELFRQGGLYVGRILKGEKPADMPVMQPTKFEFVINLHTAKLLNLTVPPTLLAIADEVIE